MLLGLPILTPCRLSRRVAWAVVTTWWRKREAPSGPLALPVASAAWRMRPGEGFSAGEGRERVFAEVLRRRSGVLWATVVFSQEGDGVGSWD